MVEHFRHEEIFVQKMDQFQRQIAVGQTKKFVQLVENPFEAFAFGKEAERVELLAKRK